jgi:hypothetical protein
MTESLEYSPFEEADSLLGNQGIPIHFMEPKISWPYSQNPATWLCLEPDYPVHIIPVYFFKTHIITILASNSVPYFRVSSVNKKNLRSLLKTRKSEEDIS